MVDGYSSRSTPVFVMWAGLYAVPIRGVKPPWLPPGRVPLEAVNATYLDQIFGVVLEAADGSFNELLALGFLESMKKEWAWRISRGESTRNLDAFRHLLETAPEGPAPSP